MYSVTVHACIGDPGGLEVQGTIPDQKMGWQGITSRSSGKKWHPYPRALDKKEFQSNPIQSILYQRCPLI